MRQESDDTPKRLLSEDEILNLGQYLASITASQAPLSAGIRALQEDAESPRLRRILRILSHRLDLGESMQEILLDKKLPMPDYFRGVLAGGFRTGKLGLVLERFIEQTQKSADLRRKVRASLAYPLLVLAAVIGIVFGVCILIIPQFKKIFADFGVELPAITMAAIGISDVLYSMYYPALVLLSISGVLLLVLMSTTFGRDLLSQIPIVGTMYYWTSLSEMYGLLELYITEKLPLPLALNLTSSAIRGSRLSSATSQIATDVQNGVLLGDAVMHRIPQGLGPVLLWGEKNSSLSETVGLASEIAEQRARAQAEMISFAMPPILFIVTVTLSGFAVIAMIMPLIKLLNELGKG